MTELAILAQRLTKRYGNTLAADGIDLAIGRGAFFGLLGPNGAGKTTIVHMLSTLIRPTSGRACVAGHPVHTHGLEVRRTIGVVFQDPALDRALSAVENLRFAGMLHGLSRAEIRRRSDALLELFGLGEQRNRPAASLSGGMRRALDLARGMIHRPQVLFLDEPTTGLDLPNRRAIWRHIARLRAEHGVTVLLTTHYLEEAADCDEVAFLHAGRLVRSGRPRDLIEALGRYVIEVETDFPEQVAADLAPRLGAALVEGDRVHFRSDDEPGEWAVLQQELSGAARAVRWRRPNLNDVFLWVNQSAASRREAA